MEKSEEEKEEDEALISITNDIVVVRRGGISIPLVGRCPVCGDEGHLFVKSKGVFRCAACIVTAGKKRYNDFQARYGVPIEYRYD